MKKLIMSLLVVSFTLIAIDASALFGIKIAISSKSYWDGTGCKPRTSGGCVHISADVDLAVGQFGGNLENTNGKLSITINQLTEITLRDFKTYFQNGNFNMGGELTFEPSALAKIGYTGNSTFPNKNYPYEIRGNSIIIHLN